ncbi:LacI family DNA-binding transcriptional regulator [Pengzhenrongella sp.]|uniref:LacI family DNA-binding transcriptional regulator n=1 Tax=Pengzhenrongella sp. TaxID=2888820 RepID=UPI002F958256
MADPRTARAGARRPTIQDVADAAGVSRALVSIVLRDAPGASEQTRVRIRGVIAELGYRRDRRARLLRQARTRTIGVSFGVRQAFHGDLVEALYVAAARQDFSLSLSAITADRSDEVAVESLLDDRPEGVILLASTLSAARLAELNTVLPTLVVARSAQGAVDAVHTDDYVGGRLATEHLIGLGHRGITYLHGGAVAGAEARLSGFRDTARAAGVDAEVAQGGLGEEAGVRAATALLGFGSLPTAVFAFNDRCALGVLDAFLRAGVRVPDEVSVVGYDDSRISRLPIVGLTTIAQNTAALAERAVELVVARVDDPTRPVAEAIVEPSLIVRSTTAPPRR